MGCVSRDQRRETHLLCSVELVRDVEPRLSFGGQLVLELAAGGVHVGERVLPLAEDSLLLVEVAPEPSEVLLGPLEIPPDSLDLELECEPVVCVVLAELAGSLLDLLEVAVPGCELGADLLELVVEPGDGRFLVLQQSAPVGVVVRLLALPARSVPGAAVLLATKTICEVGLLVERTLAGRGGGADGLVEFDQLAGQVGELLVVDLLVAERGVVQLCDLLLVEVGLGELVTQAGENLVVRLLCLLVRGVGSVEFLLERLDVGNPRLELVLELVDPIAQLLKSESTRRQSLCMDASQKQSLWY